MDDEPTIVTDIELAVADAVWRHEAARIADAEDAFDEDRFIPLALKGQPGTPLRAAYDERRRALLAWRRVRGTA